MNKTSSIKQWISIILCCGLVMPLTGCGDSSKVANGSLAKLNVTNQNNGSEDDTQTDENTDTYNASSEEEVTQEEVDYEEYYYDEDEIGEDGLTVTQRNSINMLNYMTVLAQQINESKSNQLFLESAYSSLVNDIYPNSVDLKTQAQITSLMDTIDRYRMINVKRERLNYIYEKNRAQAFRQAIPNPIALLSANSSKNLLESATSVLYMAVDSITSYEAASTQAELQFVQDGWQLDDEASAELHNSTKNALSYMLDIVRDYDIPGDYALNKESVESFVSWSQKPSTQVINKIAWLESHESTYEAFGPYWIELAKDYYNANDYKNCLKAIEQYEAVSTRIFRKNQDYANVLPMAIIAAKETMDNADYVKVADEYCAVIMDNTKDNDWSLKYFVAQIYLDLYANTNNSSYIEKAYKNAFDNVVNLVDEQKEQNTNYLADVKEVKAGKDATKQEKKEVKAYNKFLKAERKTALPPVSEALYLNCDLLFALAEKRGISSQEKNKIEAILHENGDPIFLTKALDDRFWYNTASTTIKAEDVNLTFNGVDITVPAALITDRSKILVTASGNGETKELDDWRVSSVARPKNSTVSDFSVKLHSLKADAYKYQVGQTITVRITPVAESPDKYIDIIFDAIPVKKFFIFDSVGFERAS